MFLGNVFVLPTQDDVAKLFLCFGGNCGFSGKVYTEGSISQTAHCRMI